MGKPLRESILDELRENCRRRGRAAPLPRSVASLLAPIPRPGAPCRSCPCRRYAASRGRDGGAESNPSRGGSRADGSQDILRES
jgi:hypothetical protein